MCQHGFALLDHCSQLLPTQAWEKVGTGRGSEMFLLHPSSIPCLLQVFSRGELELIADLCVKHDVLCISDEVYEWLVYDGKEHIRIGMENSLAEPGIFSGSLGKNLVI